MPRTPTGSDYHALTAHLRETAVLASAGGTLSWDQETMMPAAGAGLRAEQLSLLSGLVHDRRTDPRVGEWIARCEADPDLAADPETAANLREMRRDFERATRLPTALVRALAEVSSRALEAWRAARERSDFAAFEPWLERVLELSRRKADHYGVPEGGERYDALLQEFEPGMTSAELDRVFGELRAGLTPLIAEIRGAGAGPDDRLARVRVAPEPQVALHRWMLQRIGFDLRAGRVDVSTHPFCEGMGPGDTRITTRFAEEGFAEALASVLHEAGHALYEQGLPKEERFGQPLAESVSLGIHESQSRLWENMVGRSRPFWEWLLPRVRAEFGRSVADLSVEEAYAFMNRVAPGPIRVEADETTYNLHVMLRFDLERAMLSGELPVRDLPGAWSDRMRQDLGVDVTDHAHGPLQDIHWSMGAIGYFPTYTLGNLYAAQLWEAIEREIPDMESRIAAGEFGALLAWLRSRIHEHGRRFPAPELGERATGRPLSPVPLLGYLERKVKPLYGI